MNCIEIKHTDFTEEVLTGNYYSYYCIEYNSFTDEGYKIAFIGIDFDRKLCGSREEILLVDYEKASRTYINTNIPFGGYPPFQVSHIQPKGVRRFFEVNDKANEFIKECLFNKYDNINDFLKIYLELLSK